MDEQEDYSTAEELFKGLQQLPRSEKNKFISQIISSHHQSVVSRFIELLSELKEFYTAAIQDANSLLTSSVHHCAERVVDIVYNVLQDTLEKTISSSLVNKESLLQLVSLGHEQIEEITTQLALLDSLLLEGDLSPDHVITLGSKRERLLRQKDQFAQLVEKSRFKLMLDQNTLIAGLRPLLAKSLYVLNDNKHGNQEEKSGEVRRTEFAQFNSNSFIINLRVARNDIMKFDFVKQRVLVKAFELPDRAEAIRCPSSASLVSIQKKWLVCGGKYLPSKRINDVFLIDDELLVEAKAPMGESRAGVGLANVNNAEVLATGGCGNHNKALTYAEMYSLERDKWKKVGDMHEARSNHASCQVSAQLVYVFCGYSTEQKTGSIESYEITNESWDVVDLSAPKGLWKARDFIRAFVDGWGQIVVFGEYNGGDRTFLLEERAEEGGLCLAKAQENKQGYPPIGGYYSGTCFFGGNLFTFDDSNRLWMHDLDQWVRIV